VDGIEAAKAVLLGKVTGQFGQRSVHILRPKSLPITSESILCVLVFACREAPETISARQGSTNLRESHDRSNNRIRWRQKLPDNSRLRFCDVCLDEAA